MMICQVITVLEPMFTMIDQWLTLIGFVDVHVGDLVWDFFRCDGGPY